MTFTYMLLTAALVLVIWGLSAAGDLDEGHSKVMPQLLAAVCVILVTIFSLAIANQVHRQDYHAEQRAGETS